MKIILLTVAVSLGVAFLLGLLLGLFKKIFAVKVDPKVQAIQDVLSGGNCGGCGYAGCAAFAAAVVKGEAAPNGCIAGGPSVAEKVGQILGVSYGSCMQGNFILRFGPWNLQRSEDLCSGFHVD